MCNCCCNILSGQNCDELSLIIWIGFLLPAICSRYLFYCMFFWFFLFGQRFLKNPRADSRQILRAGVLLFRMCLLPFRGLAAPGGAEKGGNEIFVTIRVTGEFLHFGGFSAISRQIVDGSTPNFICVWTMSADVPLPHLGSIGPWGQVEGEVKNSKKWGVVSFVQWSASISIFLSASKCGSICRAQTCTHSGVEPSRSAKAILQDGPKSSKKFRVFHYFETLEAYKQCTEKRFIPPLSNCCMCLDPWVTWFCRVGQN